MTKPKYHNQHIDKLGESFSKFLESQGHKVVDVKSKTKAIGYNTKVTPKSRPVTKLSDSVTPETKRKSAAKQYSEVLKRSREIADAFERAITPPLTKAECICNEYDGKGISVCGFPCPVHPPQAKGWEKEFDGRFIKGNPEDTFGTWVTGKSVKSFIRSLLEKERKKYDRK